MGKNTIGYYWVMCPRVAEVGSLFPGVRCLDLGKLSTKSAQDWSESPVCMSVCSRTSILGALLQYEVGKMHTKHHETVVRARCQKGKKNETEKMAPSEKPRICWVDSALLTLREFWLIWRDAPLLCGFASGCGKTHRHGCAQQSWCCDAPGKQDCSRRLLNLSCEG